MTKAELIDAVKGDLSKKVAAEVVDALFDAVKVAIKKQGKFQYPGFGTFVVKKRAARKGKNPRTGATITIPASKTVGFRAASKLKEKL
jgi:DNA-binding protein HU-beta